jgi:hypothetical protein
MRDRLQLSLFDVTSARSRDASDASLLGLTSSSTTPMAAVPPQPEPPPMSRMRALQLAIRQEIPGARVVIVDTRSTLLSQSERHGVRTVRVHQMFLDADEHTRHAVARFLRGDARAGVTVDGFVAQRQHLLRFAAKPLPADAHRGQQHDLLALFAVINKTYFHDAVRAEIGWGQAGHTGRRKGRRSITFGSYDHRAQRVTIHPVLDRASVPQLVVARIVHHEMLHAQQGEQRGPDGRRVVHGRAFRAAEALFDGADVADHWLEVHLDELLRWRPAGAR